MMQIRPEWKGVPPHWMPYFLVADCDATAATTKELGGRITGPPTDVADSPVPCRHSYPRPTERRDESRRGEQKRPRHLVW
jgi:hypothetical protein